MLQTLLERFKLAIHRESKQMPVYDLRQGKGGTKLRQWKEGDDLQSIQHDNKNTGPRCPKLAYDRNGFWPARGSARRELLD